MKYKYGGNTSKIDKKSVFALMIISELYFIPPGGS